ncbi:DNA primase/helicase [Synechococcus phage S-CAM9]|uniref:DnaB-like replicative helicase n=1 Tax=Synechococcus phage S-CAM9 TaxID=1883369 RepID=A0A1D8KQ17_9CAUD|nr:DNA primase/helicase [Synechococcus phage S-CAM9]AOV60291.1 DNA primase/helicase [Synechococcus phage S-CAM9]AOV60519.1 DNA primase/helicase [Synechococcus phage S-CAM9]AOV60748.1 DNA primase/helicase [Synechococcus phage S-CAM9]
MVPFIEPSYFEDRKDRVIFDEIAKFIVKYDKPISQEILTIEIGNRDDVTDEEHKQLLDQISILDREPVNSDWILDTTEKWCKERAIYLALMESIKIADGQDSKKGRDAIPSILSDALAVSFDNHIGHDYLEDYEQRYEVYHRKEEKISFDLEYFNKITKGGLPNKTLNIALAGTGVGKSLFMCHLASSVLLQGKNVLYITLEMAEERIAERIDANLLNVNIQEIADLPKVMFENKVSNLSKKTQGQLIIKEYPTASAHAGHFRALLNELALKKSFRPDIIFVDYLNICTSSRYKGSANINSYTLIKSIAEELRGLAVEAEVPIVSATQTTRSGYGSSDVDITDTSESFGLPATADLMFALISTEELEQLGQIMVKQLKNRYNDPTINKRFIVGIDRAKMRLYDCEQTAQDDILDSGQESGYDEPESKFKSKFAELKF